MVIVKGFLQSCRSYGLNHSTLLDRVFDVPLDLAKLNLTQRGDHDRHLRTMRQPVITIKGLIAATKVQWRSTPVGTNFVTKLHHLPFSGMTSM